MFKKNCRTCFNEDLKLVVDLGNSPLANNLKQNLNDESEMFPLVVEHCEKCNNTQLNYVVDPNKLFKHYLYTSSTTESMRTHFSNAASHFINLFNLKSDNSLIVDIGSNDGVALIPFVKKGFNVLGIEPATNIAKIAIENGVDTINEFFTDGVVDSIKKRGSADILTASNVFAHSDRIEEIVKSAFKSMKPNGSFIVEVQYILDTILDLTFDNIYHEHVTYWSVHSLNNFFNRMGFKLYRVEHISTHGGSIRVFACNDDRNIDDSVNLFLNKEKEFGLNNFDTFKLFGERIETAKNNVLTNIKKIKNNGLNIVGYGSPAKATTSLNYFGIDNSFIDYIVEDNKLKHGKYIPGVDIPIFSKDKLNEKLPDIILVMAWNFFDEIQRNNQELIDKGVRFVNIKDLQNENWN